MANVCRVCKSDLVQTGVGERGRCLGCGAWINVQTGLPQDQEPIETIVPVP